MRDERRRCLRERREVRRAWFRGCFVDGARGGTLVVAKRRMRRATLDGPAAGAVERGPVRRGRLPEGRARGRAAIRRRPLPLADAERRRPVVEALRGRVVRRFPARGQPFGRGAVRGRTVFEVEGRRARARAGRERVRRRHGGAPRREPLRGPALRTAVLRADGRRNGAARARRRRPLSPRPAPPRARQRDAPRPPPRVPRRVGGRPPPPPPALTTEEEEAPPLASTGGAPLRRFSRRRRGGRRRLAWRPPPSCRGGASRRPC